jgi:hypothetical protein
MASVNTGRHVTHRLTPSQRCTMKCFDRISTCSHDFVIDLYLSEFTVFVRGPANEKSRDDYREGIRHLSTAATLGSRARRVLMRNQKVRRPRGGAAADARSSWCRNDLRSRVPVPEKKSLADGRPPFHCHGDIMMDGRFHS